MRHVKYLIGGVAVAALVAATVGASPAFASTSPSVKHTITISTGDVGPHWLALSANGKQLWEANNDEFSVDLINTVTRTVTATIPLVDYAYSVTLTPNGKQLWVMQESGELSIISTKTHHIIKTLLLGGEGSQVSFNTKRGVAYAPDYDNGIVNVVSMKSLTKVSSFTAPEAWSLVLNKSASRLYVLQYDGTVRVVNPANLATLHTFTTTLSTPYHILLSHNEKQLYLLSAATVGTVTVMSASTGAIIKTIPAGTGPHRMMVSPGGQALYVGDREGTTITVINLKTLTVSGTIPDAGGASYIAFTPDGTRAYAANYYGQSVSIIATGLPRFFTGATATVAFGGPNPVLNAGNRRILDHLIAQIPTGAKGLKIRIVGYTNVAPVQSLDLARAGVTEAYLKADGISGTYTLVSGGISSRKAVVTVTYTQG